MSLYTCSRCGASVSKNASSCPKCHARLAGIRCTNCKFAGSESDFPNDRCPKCGQRINRGSGGSSDAAAGCGCIILIIGLIAYGINCATKGPARFIVSTISVKSNTLAVTTSPQSKPPDRPSGSEPANPAKSAAANLDDFVAALDSPERLKRLNALEKLRQLGRKARTAWPRVALALGDKDSGIVNEARRTLDSIGLPGKEEISGVIALIQHKHVEVRLRAVAALGDMNDPEAIPALAIVAADGNNKVAEAAIQGLGRLAPRQPTALDALDQLIFGMSAAIARLAAVELTRIPLDPRVLRSLARGMESRHDIAQTTVRIHVESDAIQTQLPKFGRDSAVLHGAVAAHGSTAARILAIQQLGKLKEGAADGVPGLALALQSPDGRVREETLKALQSLGPIAAPASVRLATVAARDPEKPNRLAALTALKAIGPAASDAVAPLIVLFEDSDNQIGAEAVQTLAAIGKPAVPKLIAKLDDRKQIIRLGAVQSLRAIGPDAEEAIPALQKRLKAESNPTMQANIQAALKAIRKKI